MLNPLQGIERQYWYDSRWLGIPPHVPHPTYYHVLGLDSSAEDDAAFATARRALQDRLQDLSKKDMAKQQAASDLLNVLSRARSTLRDPEKRAAYLSDLRAVFGKEVRDFLEGRKIRTSAQLSDDGRRHLEETVAPLHGLCPAHASEVIREVFEAIRKVQGKTDWPPGPKFPDDPTFPNSFDYLAVAEGLAEDDLRRLADEHFGEQMTELEQKRRRANRSNLKSMYDTRIQQITAAHKLLQDRRHREKYRQELRAQRQAALGTEINRRVLAGETEVPRATYVALLDYGHRIRLSEDEVDTVLKQRSLTISGGDVLLPGRIGPLPIVDLGECEARGRRPFQFRLSNLGQQELRAQLRPRSENLTLETRAVDVPPQQEVLINAELDCDRLPGGRQSVVVDVHGPGGGEIWIYASIRIPEARLKALGDIEFGRLTVGQITSATLKIANDGDADLHCEFESDSAWLIAGESRATVRPGQAAKVPINVDLRGRPKGSYSGLIRIRSNGGDGAVRVKLEAGEPVPGSLSVADTAINLETLYLGETKAFEVVVQNTGDTPIDVTVGVPDGPTGITCAESEFTLTHRQTRPVRFELAASGDLPEGLVREQIILQSRAGSRTPVEVCYRVAAKPTAADRYATALTTLVPVTLLPALCAQMFRDIEAAFALFSLMAWSIVPVGISAFRRIWSREPTSAHAVGKAAGSLALLWVASLPALRITGAIGHLFLGLLLPETVTRIIVSGLGLVALGTGWLYCFAVSKLFSERDVRRLLPAMLGAFALAGLLSGVLGADLRTPIGESLSERRLYEFLQLTVISAGVAVACAELASNVDGWAGRAQLRVLWIPAAVVTLCLATAGFGLGSADGEASPLESLQYWQQVVRFQFLRLH